MMAKEFYKVLNFKECGDARGYLVAIEGKKDIPFDIKRIFYIYGSEAEEVRGQHANRNTEFVLINVSGKSKVKIDNGEEIVVVDLDKPFKGVYLSAKVWKEMYDFSEDSVLLVLASTHYDSGEYISDYDEWKNQILEEKRENR